MTPPTHTRTQIISPDTCNAETTASWFGTLREKCGSSLTHYLDTIQAIRDENRPIDYQHSQMR